MMSSSSLSFHLRRQNYLGRAESPDIIKLAPQKDAGQAALASHLRQIIDTAQLTPLFQPIVNLARGSIFGFEGLIRGPSNSPLHSPVQLFGVAEANGMLEEVEHKARTITLARYQQLRLPGRLFLNVSPESLLSATGRSGRTLQTVRGLGIDPSRIVIELTENQPTFDFELMREAVRHYRAMGFSIAIDDLGQGFSSLRLWSELRPEFVKIDRHFIQDVDGDAVKRQFLNSIQEIARGAGSTVIGEGIETRGEMAVVAATGIALGQGYWFARPSATPALDLTETVRAELCNGGEDARGIRSQRYAPKAASMIREVPTVDRNATTEAAYDIFETHPDLHSLPVLHQGQPVGLINRLTLIDRFARPFRRELYGRKPCTMVMDAQPLLVEADTSLQDLSFLLAETDQRHLADGFLVVENGRYRGFGSGHDVVREITRLQIEAARHTNPLSGLPGNLPLNECIEAWLEKQADFHACYCDLDHFKPFNDVFGYSRGDEMIRCLADTLRAHCDPRSEFLAHIGGDDFMVLFSSDDWEQRCHSILDHFGRAAEGFFSDEDRARGGYFADNRQGERILVPLVSLSLGVVHVESAQFSAYHQVSAAAAVAKKEAKKIPGNSISVERRRITPGPALAVEDAREGTMAPVE